MHLLVWLCLFFSVLLYCIIYETVNFTKILKAGWRSGNESRGRPRRNAGVVRLLQWLDCNDVATLHDNGKKHKELEESDASVGNLWPSENEDETGNRRVGQERTRLAERTFSLAGARAWNLYPLIVQEIVERILCQILPTYFVCCLRQGG